MNSEFLPLLYEDKDFLIAVKPIGLPSQPPKQGGDSALARLRAQDPGSGPDWDGLVHRLDTPVSGALLWARHPAARSGADALFRRGEVTKVYWACLSAALPVPAGGQTSAWGRLEDRLVHDEKPNKSRRARAGERAPLARLEYRLLGASDRYWAYEIRLLTGYTHQIRAQVALAGAPVKGDLKYGARRSNPGGGIHLLARHLAFAHPQSGQTIAVNAPVPAGDALWTWVEGLEP